MTPDDCAAVLDGSPINSESVTYLLVTGATVGEVASALDADLSRPGLDITVDDVMPDEDTSGYAFAAITGGVVAMEASGYADPSNAALRALSSSGRTAAVARSNIQAHDRFGYARDGALVFDSDEYMYVEELAEIPEEVRGLAALAWQDLDEEDARGDVDPLAVALAMGSRVTGLRVSAEDLVRAADDGFYLAPALTYLGDD